MSPPPHRSQGFTLVAILFAVAIAGTALALLGTVWHTQVKREKEAELLFVGDQYRRAIASYYQRGPGGVKHYPRKLEDLLEDRRFPTRVRHLRRLYPDPITGKAEWGLVRAPDGGIRGVYSLSEDEPLKQSNFDLANQAFESRDQYRQWLFEYVDHVPAPSGKAADAMPPKDRVVTAPAR
ncbi:MAG: type II secretion system protein [Pseudomonadota bacterium]